MENKRLIVGISGASGIIYGIRLLQVLRELNIESHLVISKAAQLTLAHESDVSVKELKALAFKNYAYQDIGAAIASGSFKTMGMIIAPCSMNCLSTVASGHANNLLTRAADVVLKERRRLVLLPREAPLHQGHIENMLKVTQYGGIIFPPVPAFYQQPQTIADLVDDTVGRVLDLFDLDCGLVKRWQ